jgi:hypothetical protein
VRILAEVERRGIWAAIVDVLLTCELVLLLLALVISFLLILLTAALPLVALVADMRLTVACGNNTA